MPSRPVPADEQLLAFPTAKDFERFLERQHTILPEIYVKYAKKPSGILSLSPAEAVEVALCFGWIDGWGKSINENWYFQRFTPRRAKSIWSQKNVNTVGRLIEEGKLRPAGLAEVEAAKADGRWDRAYAGPATITVPDDFASALAAEPTAARFFETLNKTDRYTVLWKVQTTSVKNRQKKIATMVELLKEGDLAKISSRPAAKSVKSNGTPKSKAGVKKPAPKKPAARASAVGKNVEHNPDEQGPDAGHPRRTGLRNRS